jgi:3'-5' exoribonuclease
VEVSVVERRYAVELVPGDRVDAHFALVSKELRAARTGEGYLALGLSDRSGHIPAIMFRPSRDAEAIPTGTVISVTGTVTSYRGVTRVSVASLKPAATYDRREILPSGVRDPDELLGSLRSIVRSIADPGLSSVVRTVFADAAFTSAFRLSPATVDGHRAYLGGLLEHTVGVARICDGLAKLHPQIERDVLLAGALLHDIGMVDAVRFDTSVETTDAGRLLGHAVLGERRLARAVENSRVRPAPAVVTRLTHMLLSHHAHEDESGSVRPSTLEAITLARADRLDAVSYTHLTLPTN